MKAKKILIVFPHNFFELKSGVHKRFYELVKCLHDQSFTIDLLGLENFESNWKETKINHPEKLVNDLFLYDFSVGYRKDLLKKGTIWKKIAGKKTDSDVPSQIFDFAYDGMKSFFREIITKNKYDFILISYVYWANLLEVEIPYKTCRILTMEDFITQNLFDTYKGKIDVGKFLNEEIRRVNLFDRVICLSHEEQSFFSRFASNPVYYYLPVFMESKPKKAVAKEYDILFVGFDNFSNRNGLDWFFNGVYPLLEKNLKILIAGKISKFVPHLPNVTCVDYFEDIGDAYARSRITINPLQDGTGMKVKMIESMSYGVPIVNTPRGLCGIKPVLLHDFIIAEEPSEFARQINKLISDEAYYQTQCALMRSLFENHFEVKAISKVLNEIFAIQED
jgi:glycosyltransferase involved in cell wall biosynthesis